MHFPSFYQHDSMDCGPTCLRMIAKFYGKSYSLQTLRDKCHITREGVSMLGISDAAESVGFRTTGIKLTWVQLCEEIPLPCIVHWNQKHFVVVYDINRKGMVTVADPASGLLKYNADDFLKCWLQSEDKDYGLALLLEPTPAFYKEEGEEEHRYGFLYVLQYLKPYRSYITLLLTEYDLQRTQWHILCAGVPPIPRKPPFRADPARGVCPTTHSVAHFLRRGMLYSYPLRAEYGLHSLRRGTVYSYPPARGVCPTVPSVALLRRRARCVNIVYVL